MRLEEMMINLNDVIANRFEKEEESQTIGLKSLDDNNLEKCVLRIKRMNRPNLKTYRTFLIVQLSGHEGLKHAVRWSAAVKNKLTDPETSDLYLIVVSENNSFSIEYSMSIEATESYCKKYVQREDESPESLIKRTCLANLSVINEDAIKVDPVKTVLLKTEQKFSWFNSSIQKKWEQAFYSENTGNELLDKIR